MPKRSWDLPAENDLPDGWTPDSGQPVAVVSSLEALQQEMLNAAWVLWRFGGTFSAGAFRREIAPGIWVPDRYVLVWESYAPGQRLREEPPQEEPEPLAHEEQPELVETP